MCGIGGFSGDFDPRLLPAMNRALAHRGPDDEGVAHFAEHRIGLCHRRLSIIDLSTTGKQPMWDTARRACISFNGEIYNYRELRKELESRGYVFATGTDTEVLINLYLAEGVGMLTRLVGIFAFAIWDTATKQMLVARDGFGVKPLYYALTPSGFLFSSEMKALLAEPSLPRRIDAHAVQAYLTYLWSPAPRTMLSAVKKVMPGHALLVEDGQIVRSWQYYDIPAGTDKSDMAPKAAATRLRALLDAAVARQMVSDVPVGAFLSGGLDSSAVACFARQHAAAGHLDCFTIAFRDRASEREGMCEDLPYAKKVASALGLSLNVVEVGPEMADEFGEMVFHLDEPEADPAALNVLFISRLARENGIKVLLSGAGGDDVFSGYRRHQALWLEHLWKWMPAGGLRALKQVASSGPMLKPDFRRLAKLFAYADAPDDERLAAAFNWVDPGSCESLLSVWTRAELAASGGENLLLDALGGLPSQTESLDRMLYLETRFFLADHNLNYTDKMAMAAGVEVRVPFLDNDLVAFAASLPTDFKQHRMEGKWILKKAMEPLLPRDVIYRPKTGFGAPVRHWLRNELRWMVDDMLSEETILARGLFDPVGVAAFLEKDRMGLVDGAYTILALICVELWCRRFLDA